jgi:hypothetical protein
VYESQIAASNAGVSQGVVTSAEATSNTVTEVDLAAIVEKATSKATVCATLESINNALAESQLKHSAGASSANASGTEFAERLAEQKLRAESNPAFAESAVGPSLLEVLAESGERFEIGDLAGAEKTAAAAEALVEALDYSTPENLTSLFDSNGKPNPTALGLGLFSAATEAEKQNLGNVADSLRSDAADLMNLGFAAARIHGLTDLGASLMELYSGQTMEVDPKTGKLVFRETSTTEKVFAALSVLIEGGAVGVGAVAGGPIGAAAVVSVAPVVKAGAKLFVEAVSPGAKTALKGAEDAIERAGKLLEAGLSPGELAAKEAENAGTLEKILDEMGTGGTKLDNAAGGIPTLDEKAANHVIRGDYDQSGMLNGGLHTFEGTRNYLQSLPSNVAEKVVQKKLPNGVGQVVYPSENALTKGAFKSTAEAEKYGHGVAGGKTLFPESWSEAKIKEAVEHVIKAGNKIEGKGGQYSVRGKYDGVEINVSVGPNGNGRSKINSAYPTWEQL